MDKGQGIAKYRRARAKTRFKNCIQMYKSRSQSRIWKADPYRNCYYPDPFSKMFFLVLSTILAFKHIIIKINQESGFLSKFLLIRIPFL